MEEKSKTQNDTCNMDNSNTIEMEEKKKLPKATAEDAKRIEELEAMLQLYFDDTKTSPLTSAEADALNEEYADLFNNYDWFDEPFEQDGKKGLKNVKGEIVVPAKYDGFCYTRSLHFPGIVAANRGKMVVLLARDGSGKELAEAEADYCENVLGTSVYALLDKQSGKWALWDGEKLLCGYELDGFSQSCNGWFETYRDGKKGLASTDGACCYEPRFDDIEGNIGERTIFWLDGVKGYLTYDGKFVSEESLNDDTYTEDEACELEDSFLSETDEF